VPGKQRFFVSNDEIQETLEGSTAEQAAKTLVDLAVGRNVDDNVTAVVVELPGRVRSRRLMPNLRVGITAAFAISAVLIVIFGVLLVVVPQLAPDSGTPVPTPINAFIRDGSLAYQPPGGDVQALHGGDILAFGPGAIVTLAGEGATLDLPGNYRLYLAGLPEMPTQVEFVQAGREGVESQMIMNLRTGSLAMIAAGGADTHIRVVASAGVASVSFTGSVRMGARFENAQLVVDCYSGGCQLDNGAGAVIMLASDQRAIVDASGNLSGPMAADPNAYPEYPVP
jgi:hypothetical protein